MAIAIPMVSKYIEQSRKKAHMITSAAFVDGLTKEIVSNNLPLMMDSDTVYYIPFNCIPIEKGGTSPHGTWEFAYVLMTYDSGNRNYYIYSKDAKGMGIEGVKVEKIKASDVKHILGTKDDLIEIPGKTKSSIVQDSCDFGSQLVRTDNFTPADSCFEISSWGTIEKWKTLRSVDENDGYIFEPNDPCYATDIIIPETINGITVKYIGISSFAGYNLTSVKIPNSSVPIEISIGAFSYNNLTKITIPNNVTHIANGAFYANKLTTLTLPSNINDLGLGAFGANNLNSVNVETNLDFNQSEVFCENPTLTASNINSPRLVNFVNKECLEDIFAH